MSTFEIASDIRRKEPRYRLADHSDVRVFIKIDDSADPIDAHIIDLSNSGIQLRALASLKFEQPIKIFVTARELHFDLDASVKWLRQADEESWLVGCRIDPEMSEETVSQLAAMALLERRGGERREVCLDAEICGQLGSSPTPAVLRNLSEDGIGLTTTQSLEVGQRIRLQLRQRDGEIIEATARVVWQLTATEGFVCGCILLNKECFSQLNELADARAAADSTVESPTALSPPPEQDKALQPSHWVSAAAVLIISFASLFVVLRNKGASPEQPVAQSQPAAEDERGPAPDADAVARREASTPKTDEPPATTSPDAPSRLNVTELLSPIAANQAPQANVDWDDVISFTRELAKKPRRTTVATVASKPIEPTEPAKNPPAEEPPTEKPSTEKRPAEFRTWTDHTGQHKTVARLLLVENGKARLERPNGRHAAVSLDRLSPEDTQYIQRWLKASE